MSDAYYLVEMRSGVLVEWFTTNLHGGGSWTLNRSRAFRIKSLESAYKIIEYIGCGGKDNVRAVRIDA